MVEVETKKAKLFLLLPAFRAILFTKVNSNMYINLYINMDQLLYLAFVLVVYILKKNVNTVKM